MLYRISIPCWTVSVHGQYLMVVSFGVWNSYLILPVVALVGGGVVGVVTLMNTLLE